MVVSTLEKDHIEKVTVLLPNLMNGTRSDVTQGVTPYLHEFHLSNSHI